MKKKLGIMLALAAMFQFSSIYAAPIDGELAILASEQVKENTQLENEEKVDIPAPKTKKELEAEEKKLREEKREEEKRLNDEKKAARKKIEEGKREQIPPINDNRRIRQTSSDSNSITPTVDDSVSDKKKLVEETNINPPSNAVSEIPQEVPLQNSAPAEDSVAMPNPMKSYSNFDEISKALGFTPLYIPKKSGYTINEISSIDNRIAEIRYGRRWEPEVSLAVRTYKRQPNEELQDISGINGAKWRVDESGGSSIYLAKLNDNDHAAAWAVGDFTFSAYVQNLSFAAFYALVVEELVDLSNHYYVA